MGKRLWGNVFWFKLYDIMFNILLRMIRRYSIKIFSLLEVFDPITWVQPKKGINYEKK